MLSIPIAKPQQLQGCNNERMHKMESGCLLLYYVGYKIDICLFTVSYISGNITAYGLQREQLINGDPRFSNTTVYFHIISDHALHEHKG